MTLRASWIGTLRLSLIVIPVRLYRAVASTNPFSFHLLHQNCHQRLQQEYRCPQHGPVAREDFVKGYEYEKGKHVVVDEETLDAVKLETEKTIDVIQFIDPKELDPLLPEIHYYMAPDSPVAEEAFRVFHEAMRKRKKTAIGRFVSSGKEHVVAIQPRDKGLVLQTLHYAYEVRDHQHYFADIANRKPGKEELELAMQLIEKLSSPFEPEQFQDRYNQALSKIIDSKLKGEKIIPCPEKEIAQVVDFMAALKKSLAASGNTKGNTGTQKPRQERTKRTGKGHAG